MIFHWLSAIISRLTLTPILIALDGILIFCIFCFMPKEIPKNIIIITRQEKKK